MTSPVDLWRNGNTTTPRLDNVRANDVDTYQQGDVTFVKANGKGITSFDSRAGALLKGKNWWKLPAGSPVVPNLKLINDNNPPGHWVWAPVQDMPKDEYVDLLVMQGEPAAKDGNWQGPITLTTTLVADNLERLASLAARGAPMPLSPKAHAFVIDAVQQHVRQLQSRLSEIVDSPLDEDEASDLTNDLVLYELIVRHLTDQTPTSG